jgi:L-iditol 2-dehydrogenase
VAAAGICGSDVHAYEWTPGYEFMAAAMPVTMGRSASMILPGAVGGGEPLCALR